MAVVSFKKGTSWLVARWAFRRLFDDIRLHNKIEADMEYKFVQVVALDGLHFELIEPGLRKRILSVMQKSVQVIIADTALALQGSLDIEGYKMYRNALPELLGYIEQYKRDTELIDEILNTLADDGESVVQIEQQLTYSEVLCHRKSIKECLDSMLDMTLIFIAYPYGTSIDSFKALQWNSEEVGDYWFEMTEQGRRRWDQTNLQV